MSELSDAAAKITEAAARSEVTTEFFDSVTTLGVDEYVTNTNNGLTVPSVQTQINDLYNDNATEITAAVEASEAARDESVAAKDEVLNRVASYEVETTEYLINTFDSSTMGVGDVVKTVGFSTDSDGGGASWSKTGNTGASSQSPSETGSLTLFSANGDEFSWVEMSLADPIKFAVDDDDMVSLSYLSGKPINLSNKIYSVGGFPTPSLPVLSFSNNASRNGDNLPYMSIAPLSFNQLPETHAYIRQVTSKRNDATSFTINRIVDFDDGSNPNPKALRVITDKNVDGDGIEYAISGEINSYANNSSGGDTAVSGTSNKYGNGQLFGGHYQVNDYEKVESRDEVGSIVGCEINLRTQGLDRETQNNGLGVRRCLDLIAKTNSSADGHGDGTGNDGIAEIGAGLLVRSSSDGGYFRYGVIVTDQDSGQESQGAITTGIEVSTKGVTAINVVCKTSEQAIKIDSTAGITPVGVRFVGTFDDGAIKLSQGQAIAWEGTSTVKTVWESSKLKLYGGENELISFGTTLGTASIYVRGVQVVSTRKTGWEAPTGTSSRGAFDTSTATTEELAERLKALIIDLTSHGLIGS